MKTTAPLAPSILPSEPSSHRWFSSIGYVVADRVEVFVGGTLIASFAPGDQDSRNVALIGLAEDPKAHLGRLAAALRDLVGAPDFVPGIQSLLGNTEPDRPPARVSGEG